ncbi:hypothetical protein [Nocardia mexicana]|uniref:Uncharacterized protein n=1 Tax=Nocardia mexicana TaxID=279262 RepID=A0A370HAR0_9NOCA|nr:hypothetical protein [Nocardia mexicana]RDI54013.1 hypothetical protein DFR68_102134 [Nocardia mexicana]
MPKKQSPNLPVRLTLDPDLLPTVPSGDDPHIASEIANFVLELVDDASEDLKDRLTYARYQAAPASIRHADHFHAVLNRAALEWLREWPQ